MSTNKTTQKIRQRGLQSTRNHSKSPSSRNSPSTPRRSSRLTPKPIEVFQKCYSEPIIFPAIGECRSLDSDEGGWFCRVNTLDDLFLCTDSPESAVLPLTQINAGYEKDSKVVISVTVEGSPGPIKALVKLGSSVEDTIKLVVDKYKEEGRTPALDKHSASSFDLHVSYFSLQCLDRSSEIGDVGTRSFYLRKSNKKSCGGNKLDVTATSLIATSEYMLERANSSPSLAVLPPVIGPKLRKIIRRVRRGRRSSAELQVPRVLVGENLLSRPQLTQELISVDSIHHRTQFVCEAIMVVKLRD